MIQFELFTTHRPQPVVATDHTEARQLRDRGIQRATDHAGSEWSARAYVLLTEFVRALPRDRRFMTEQVRAYAYERGLPSPPSERAWGGVTMKAVKNGLIISMGLGKVTNKRAHCANAAVWRKC